VPTPIRKIARLAASLSGHAPRNAADESWLGAALQTYLDGADLDQALGVQTAAGDRDCRTIARQTKRDTLLRELAAEMCPEKPITRQAEYLEKVISRYSAGPWVHERGRAIPFERNRKLWELLRLYPSPLGARRIRMILGGK
jgi:hypothetical protein